MPEYNGSTPERPADAQYFYTFAGWEPEVTAASSDSTYTAKYDSNRPTYTITWKNWDGKVLDTDSNVKRGETPKYNGRTPERAADDQFIYTFAGWDPVETAASSDTTYTAKFSPNRPTYKITWKNWDGKVLGTTGVTRGETPKYNGRTPERAADDQFIYTFAGWDPVETAASSDTTYTAKFSPNRPTYKITWKNWDGKVLGTTGVTRGETPKYNGRTPERPADAQYIYTFAGWDPVETAASSDSTYTAQFSLSRPTYTITWQNWDGTVLDTDASVKRGDTPRYNGRTPERAADEQYTYTFMGWDPVETAASSDSTYTAKFEQKRPTYKITWKNWDGKVLETDANVKRGETPRYNGQTVERAADEQYTYTFMGWGPVVTAASSDTTYTAKFEQNRPTYTITWKNWDGKVLDTDSNVKRGETPNYNGRTPERPADAENTYTFEGWEPAISAAAGDTAYIAHFHADPRETWVCLSCGAVNDEADRFCVNCQHERPDETWVCPSCGTVNDAADRFCVNCREPHAGQDETWICLSCGTVNDAADKFCVNCREPHAGQDETWICQSCGAVNDAADKYCVSCRQKRAP